MHIKLEHVGGQPKGGTGIGYIHHPTDVALDRSGTQDGVSLRPGIAKFLQILNGDTTDKKATRFGSGISQAQAIFAT